MSENKAYKFFDREDQNKKLSNYELMSSLGYFQELSLVDVGKTYTLLSYNIIEGRLLPTRWEEIESALEIIAKLHSETLVHGDIREGNIIFNGKSSYLIDFDFTARCGTLYPSGYNSKIKGRHETASAGHPREFIHDYFSLICIANEYLPHFSYKGSVGCCLCSSCKR